MQSKKTLSFACMLLALLIGAHGTLALAQQGPKVRFSNWEFDPMPLLQKVEQTADKLVYKLDKSVPGPGGTVTLQAGKPLKGTLAATLDGEWKRLTAGHKFTKTEPDDDTALADGTKVLRRSAMTANGGFFSVTAFAAPDGVNLMLMEAGDDMATQMLSGMTFGFFATVKLHPVGAPTTLAKAGKPATEKPAETPQEEMARLNREMKQSPMMQNPMSAMGMPAESTAPGFRKAGPIAVPKLDKARIASIPSRVLSDRDLQKYLGETVPRMETKIPQQLRATGDRLLGGVKAKIPGPTAIETAAIGMYALGNPKMALYFMGKAVQANPSDPTTLNNYAAFLSMNGAQENAVAILQNLEQKFPKDITVLNNLGQAWFGLGDIDKADHYIGRALWIGGRHSQANFTKSAIERARGKHQAAREAMKKSMQSAFSEEKASLLEEMGHKIDEKDIPWDEPFKEDPMKLHKALDLIPPYYFEARDVPVAKARWEGFHNMVHRAMEQHEAATERLTAASIKATEKFTRDVMAGRKRHSPVALKFTLKYVTFGRRPVALMDQLFRWNREEEAVGRQISDLYRRLQDRQRANPNAPCGTQEAIVTEFMSKANKLMSDLQSESRIKARIRWLNEWAQLYRYYNTPTQESYQLYLHDLKGQFLTYLTQLQHHHPDVTLCPKKAGSRSTGKLQQFEDLHCERKYSFTVPGIGTIRGNCHYLETDFSVFGVSGTTKEDLLTGEFVRGTIEVGAEIGGSGEKIPYVVKGSIEAKAGGYIEFDGQGVTDFGATAGVEVSGGVDSGDVGNPMNVSAGVTTRMSVVNGPSVSVYGP